MVKCQYPFRKPTNFAEVKVQKNELNNLPFGVDEATPEIFPRLMWL